MPSPRSFLILILLLAGCGAGSTSTPGECTTDCPTAAAYDACGGRIVRSDGSIDADEYRRQAGLWSREVIDCRLGPDFVDYHPTAAGDDRPLAYEPPTMTNPYGANARGLPYQLGGPPTEDPGAFGSIDAQILYAPDEPVNPGIDRLITYLWVNDTIHTAPMPTWHGAPDCWWPDCTSNPDPLGQRQDLADAMGHPVREPMAMARSLHFWSQDAVIVLRGGFLAATGTETSDSGFAWMHFPPEKVPMAVALSNENEFAFVAIWDTQAVKGQIAVVALEAATRLVHAWYYIGFPSVGGYTTMKLLGYVDLPDMVAPTDLDVTTSNGAGPWPGGLELGDYRLDTQDVRDRFAWPDGDLHGAIAMRGQIAVISRWEGKVTFIDLEPLLSYFHDMYLTTQERFDETQASAGPAPDQWPYAFSVRPESAPVVVKTLPVATPTAVLAGSTRTQVASLDGTLTRFDTSSLKLSDRTTDPAAIVAVGSLQVGRNPTRMIWPRNRDPLNEHSSPYQFDDIFLVLSRGDRTIEWIDLAAEGGPAIFRRFEDRRLVDPVDMDVSEQSYVITVADFAGRQVVNYRFAPTPAHHLRPERAIGLGAGGTAAAECGGALPIAGTAFRVSSTNVN
jgi:hypothetical protein